MIPAACLARGALGSVPAADQSTILRQTMSTFSSTIQILAVENEEKTSKRTGSKYQHFAARSILLSDDGEVITVGALRTRNEELQKQCKPGTYRATFTLQVPDYGDNKGDIVAELTALTPITLKQATSAPAKA